MSEPRYPTAGMVPVCCDCGKTLRPHDPKVSNGPKLWRCAACEYHRQRFGAA